MKRMFRIVPLFFLVLFCLTQSFACDEPEEIGTEPVSLGSMPEYCNRFGVDLFAR